MGSRNKLINTKELTPETFVIYGKLFFVQEICKVIPVTSPLQYEHIYVVVNGVEKVLFESINTETGKLLLANKVYTLIRCLTGEEVSREFLYNLATELAECMPDMEDEIDKGIKEIQEMVNNYANTKYNF